MQQEQHNNKIIIRLLTILCIVFLLFVLYFFDFKIPCVFHKITGFYCPGCGITRSLISLIKFEFYQSFRYNPLVFILYPFLIPYSFYLIYIWIFDKEDKITKKIPQAIFIGIVIILLIYGVIRNIDFFDFLVPTVV